MKFHFIAAHRQEFRLRSLCGVLGVSRSGFYAWARRPQPRQTERNAALLVHIRAAYRRGRQAYGAPRIHRELRADALTMAITTRQPGSGLLFHSDRGGQYLSTAIQQLLDQHGLCASTSRPGQCLDNAVAESFFHTLKTEIVYQHRYRTREEARIAIFDYIVAFYKRTRRHSTLAYHSPEEYERRHAVR